MADAWVIGKKSSSAMAMIRIVLGRMFEMNIEPRVVASATATMPWVIARVYARLATVCGSSFSRMTRCRISSESPDHVKAPRGAITP